MTVDPTVLPGLLLLAAELVALAAVGYVVVRVALRQADERAALAQGLVVGLALWGLIVNFILYAVPGLAGAAVGWGVVLTLGAVLAWRSPDRIRPRPRMVAGFTVAVLALLWVALASRQALSIPDPHTQLGLAASIRAGGFPPELFWNPGTPAPYHHGVSLLVGLLMPPVGPDLAFVMELLGAYAWMSFALVIVTLLLQRASRFAVAVTAPLLLTAGAWTFTWVGEGLLELPVLAGMPSAGIRASVMDIYWPPAEQSWEVQVWKYREAALPDIWKPGFPLAYALVLIVLERAARASGRSWPATLTLAGLVGFVGLLAASLAPVALALWAGLEAVHLGRDWRARSLARSAVLRSSAGLVLAVLVLLGGGGRFTGLLGGPASSGLTLGWNEHQQGWRVLGEVDPRPGGVGLAGVGPLVVAVVAALLARRDRLVLALAVGAGGLALAYLALHYPPYPLDVHRLAGHARNFALVALLLALSVRLAALQPRWRYAASGLLVVLVIWPTVVSPVRNLGLAVGHGPLLTNAEAGQRVFSGSTAMGRHVITAPISERVAAYVRDHTAVDARILSPSPLDMAVATGRPNGSGFVGLIHLVYILGPDYLDALNYLEPTAIQWLGTDYVHATAAWRAELPERARRWLADPGLFEPLMRDGGEALYRVRPAFLELEVLPHRESFEALRQAVPPSTVVALAPQLWLGTQLQVASVLSHTQLAGADNTPFLHFLTPAPWTVEPLGERTPDLVVLPMAVEPWTWMFPSAARRPIWRSGGLAVYAPTGALAPITPPGPAPEPPPVSVRVSGARVDNRRITFTAAFEEHAPERWTGQDWIVVKIDSGPLDIPTGFRNGANGPATVRWFGGLLASGSATRADTYTLDVPASSLAVRDDRGAILPLAASEGRLDAGTWILALRLRHEWQPGYWREAAVIPVLRIRVSEAGEVSYQVYDDVLASEDASGNTGAAVIDTGANVTLLTRDHAPSGSAVRDVTD